MVQGSTPSDDAARRRNAWLQAQRRGRRGVWIRNVVRHRAVWALPAYVLLALWLIGVIYRLFLQDRLPGLFAYPYYALPPVVLTILPIVASVCWLIAGKRRIAVGALTAGMLCGCWAYATTWFHHTPVTSPQGTRRVLFWNISHGEAGFERIVDEIRTHNPDIIAVVESSPPGNPTMAEARVIVAQMEEFWSEHLPEYDAYVSVTGITTLARNGLKYRCYVQLFNGWAIHCEVPIEGTSLHLVVADVAASLSGSRASPLLNLYEHLDTLAEQPVVVVGDFNTPADSVYFDPLRLTFRNAFETAGNGYAATWPLPIPLLTLDQAWISDQLSVSQCSLGWSRLSDHRPIILDISLAP